MFGGAFFVAVEDGGEILAGVEAGLEGDVGDGQVRLLAEQSGGGFDALIVDVFQWGHVGQLPADLGKMGDSEAALFGHGRGGPGLGQQGVIALDGFEE